jgi:hypothetical protein
VILHIFERLSLSVFCGFCCPLSEGLFIISHPLAFVKGFFKTFLSFFQPLFSSERMCPNSIPHSLAFVKRFFKSFFNFFCGFFSAPSFASFFKSAVSQLAYYSTSLSFCQQVFAKFFRFGEASSNIQNTGMVFVRIVQCRLAFGHKPENQAGLQRLYTPGFRSLQTVCASLLSFYNNIAFPNAHHLQNRKKLQKSSKSPLHFSKSMVYCMRSRSRNGRCVG